MGQGDDMILTIVNEKFNRYSSANSEATKSASSSKQSLHFCQRVSTPQSINECNEG